MATGAGHRAVLFDLDGTLLDTLRDIAFSANKALCRLGFPQHGLEAYKYFVGDGRDALAVRILPGDHRDSATIARLVDCIDQEYSQHWSDTTQLYTGIPELLQSLKDRGIKMAVLSNKPDDATKLAVSRFLPRWQFELVLGVRPDIPKKPSPAAALEVARCLDLLPDEFVYLGDTDTDMRTAQAAGMLPVGALWGFRTGDELLASGARELIRNPIDLLKIL